MKHYYLAILLLLIFNSCKKSGGSYQPQPTPSSTTFSGRGGIYYLGMADIANPASAYNNTSLAGLVIRFKWETFETSPGVFNWSFIDSEIAKAKAAKKKVSMQILGYPNWIKTSIGASTYKYIDRNPLHSTYLDTLEGVLQWDVKYLERIANLINKFADKYANDTTVAYFNLIAGQISRQLPDSVVTPTGSKAFWTTYSYNADSVVSKMNTLLDLYMSRFPNTPIWNSMDYVTFEMRASGKALNYLASQYTVYGVSKYPNRFGCWREDLAACNPQNPIPATNQWYVLNSNPTRTGSQMLWSVQDGPDRMNKCGVSPNTKGKVLDSSINNGLRVGMRYFEVYAADIQDASLSSNIAAYDALLKSKYQY